MPEGNLRSDHDVEQILKLAVRNAGYTDEAALRQRLHTAGAELGLSDAQINAAEEQYYREQEEAALRAEFEKKALHEFYEHLWTYLIVNAGLIGFDFLKDGRLTWAYWPVIAWGIAMAIHAYSVFFPSKRDYDEEYQKWKRKHGRRRRRKGVTIGINVGSGLLDNASKGDEQGEAEQRT